MTKLYIKRNGRHLLIGPDSRDLTGGHIKNFLYVAAVAVMGSEDTYIVVQPVVSRSIAVNWNVHTDRPSCGTVFCQLDDSSIGPYIHSWKNFHP
jgi:hypothetical protein